MYTGWEAIEMGTWGVKVFRFWEEAVSFPEKNTQCSFSNVFWYRVHFSGIKPTFEFLRQSFAPYVYLYLRSFFRHFY